MKREGAAKYDVLAQGDNRIWFIVDGVLLTVVSHLKSMWWQIGQSQLWSKGMMSTHWLLALLSPADIAVDRKIISVTETEPENWVDNPYPRISSGEVQRLSCHLTNW